jgi:hypothetical protein
LRLPSGTGGEGHFFFPPRAIMSKKRASIGPARHRSSRERRLLLESLETRQLLAGDITASVVDGRLTLTGDDAANEVFVGDLGDGRFVIRGMAGATGAATTINGQAEVIVEGVVDTAGITDITANLGGGDDRFLFSIESDWSGGNPFSQGWTDGAFKPLLHDHGYASLAGKLVVNLGDGNDTAVITGSASAGMEIEGGSDAGDDGVFIRTNVAQSTHYVVTHLGGGNDYVALSLESIPDAVDVTTGDGNDTVLLAYRTDANLNLDTGAGNDRVVVEGGYTSPGKVNPAPANGTDNTLTILTGTGDDNIALTQLFASKLIVDSGLGLDEVTIKGININGDVSVRGGGVLNSKITLTDCLSFGPIDRDTAFPPVTYIDTRIGGNLTINFNAEASSWGGNEVLIGQWQANGSATGFTVGGAIQFFGTIYEDALTINPLTASSLQVDTGYGEDTVRIRGITIADNVDIQLNDGNDRALIIEDAVHDDGWDPSAFTATRIGGNLRLDFGAGDEQIGYSQFQGLNMPTFSIGARHSGLTSNFVVGGDLFVDAGAGRGELSLVAGTFRNIDIKLGDGYSILDMQVFLVEQSLSITSASLYHDRWTLDSFGVGGNVTLRSGGGNAEIKIANTKAEPSSIAGDLIITTGNGQDQVEIGNGNSVNGLSPPTSHVNGVLQVETGSGDDTVNITEIRDIDVLLARLGDGADYLSVFHSPPGYGILDGGAGGSDTIGGDDLTSQLRNFEQDGRSIMHILRPTFPGIE